MSLSDSIIQIVIAAGGTTIVVLAIVAALWRVAEKSIVETVKHSFAQDIAELKSGLALSATRTNRYEDAQFGVYAELWDSLAYLSFAANRLWESATQRNLSEFESHLDKAQQSVFHHRLLVDPRHTEDLKRVLDGFARFYHGKEGLIKLLQRRPDDTEAIQNAIADNERIKNEFTGLVNSIGESFQKQLKKESSDEGNR